MKHWATLLLLFIGHSYAQQSYAGPQIAVPASYFGIDSGHPFSTSPAVIPVGTLLTMDVSEGASGIGWDGINTASGTYSWAVLDGVVSIAQSNNIPDIVYVLHSVPAWNSSNPTDSTCAEGNGTCDPNASPAAFTTFINAITQRYCGTIKYWSGWNEANTTGFWNASIPLLVTYMQAMYTAVHSTANCACLNGTCSPALPGGANPNKMITPPMSSPAFFTANELVGTPQQGSAGYSIGPDYWLKTYLAAGGSSAYDIVGIHSYGSNGTCYAGPEVYVVDVANVKQVFANANLPIPQIWATELNWGLNSCVSGNAAMNSWIARYYLLHWAMGFSRALWYVYDAPAGGSFGLIATGSQQLATYQDMQQWMTGAVQQNCLQLTSNNWSCAFVRASPAAYKAYAVWNSTGTGSYTVPTGVIQYRDVLNNITSTTGGATIALTASPLLFETVAGAF